jgi:hypothetical protein
MALANAATGPVCGAVDPANLTAGRLVLAERTIKAMDLRRGGRSWRSIARECGWADGQSARRNVKAALEDVFEESVLELRAIENDRYDALLEVLWPRALDGELPAIDRVLRIAQQRALMNGLNAPVRVDVVGEVVTYAYVGVDVSQV